MSLINFVKKLIQKQRKRTEDDEGYFYGNNSVRDKIALSKTSSLPPNLSLNEVIREAINKKKEYK